MACEVAKAAGVIKRYDPALGTLPYQVADWLGIDHNPRLRKQRYKYLATFLNDSMGMSFPEIADSIELTFELKRKR